MSDLYAIIQTSGKQYRVSPGDRILIDKINGEKGQKITFDQVLALGSSSQAAVIGTPLISGANVTGKILAQSKSKKIVVFKKKRRTGYTKKQGHRSQLTQVLVEAIHGA